MAGLSGVDRDRGMITVCSARWAMHLAMMPWKDSRLMLLLPPRLQQSAAYQAWSTCTGEDNATSALRTRKLSPVWETYGVIQLEQGRVSPCPLCCLVAESKSWGTCFRTSDACTAAEKRLHDCNMSAHLPSTGTTVVAVQIVSPT